MVDTRAAIDEYVDLALRRHRGRLKADTRWRLEALEDVLRDLIDGAHPAPRRIENPSAVGGVASRVRPNVEPAKVVVTKNPSVGPGDPEAPPTIEPAVLPASALVAVEAAPAVALSDNDKSKVREVDEADLPASGYTPPTAPCYLEDYYTADLRALSGGVAVSRVVGAGGPGDLDLLQEARVLLGVPAAPAAPAVAPTPVAAAPSGATPPPVIVPSPAPAAARAPAAVPVGGPPAIVHLLAGGFRRGRLVAFDPAGGSITVQESRDGGPPATIALPEVLAVFFGVARGQSATPPPAGQRLAVKLVNDREVIGVSGDYAPGVTAMTVVPDDRRGNVDHIWVPAWSVKEIRFA
jgi:hypothetical protein